MASGAEPSGPPEPPLPLPDEDDEPDDEPLDDDEPPDDDEPLDDDAPLDDEPPDDGEPLDDDAPLDDDEPPDDEPLDDDEPGGVVLPPPLLQSKIPTTPTRSGVPQTAVRPSDRRLKSLRMILSIGFLNGHLPYHDDGACQVEWTEGARLSRWRGIGAQSIGVIKIQSR